MKNKTTAGIFALLLGGLGIHKFYLGKVGMGILYLVFCWTFIPSFVGFIEGIILLSMDENKFNMKYNKGYISNLVSQNSVVSNKTNDDLENLKAKKARIQLDMKNILRNEYYVSAKKKMLNLKSKEEFEDDVMSIMSRQNELKQMYAEDGIEYEELDFVAIHKAAELDLTTQKLDDEYSFKENSWKNVAPEIREELSDRRRDHYNLLKEITDNCKRGKVTKEDSLVLLQKWKEEEQELIKDYALAKLYYHPIFDYWGKHISD